VGPATNDGPHRVEEPFEHMMFARISRHVRAVPFHYLERLALRHNGTTDGFFFERNELFETLAFKSMEAPAGGWSQTHGVFAANKSTKRSLQPTDVVRNEVGRAWRNAPTGG